MNARDRVAVPPRVPEIAPEGRDWLAGAIATVLVGSPFQGRKRWREAVIVLRSDGRRVMSRGDFAHWLAANDLRQLAHECIRRRVPAGHVWLEVDVAHASGVGFMIFDFAAAARVAVRREDENKGRVT
jgi:hypothetical protein